MKIDLMLNKNNNHESYLNWQKTALQKLNNFVQIFYRFFFLFIK